MPEVASRAVVDEIVGTRKLRLQSHWLIERDKKVKVLASSRTSSFPSASNVDDILQVQYFGVVKNGPG